MSLFVPYLAEEAIERDAAALLAEFAQARGVAIVPPIPIEDIVEKHLKLRMEFDDTHRRFGVPRASETEPDILGAIFSDGRIVIDESLQGLVWAQNPPEIMPPTALLVRAEVAKEQLRPAETVRGMGGAIGTAGDPPSPGGPGNDAATTQPAPRQPTRFYGSVEIDMVRPVNSFDAILNAVVMELQRTHGAKVKLTLEIEAEAPAGFADADIGVVRDNAKQLKFNPASTGFDEQ